MVQEEVLSQMSDAEVSAYVVWEPVLRADGRIPARRATSLVEDPRATHFWADGLRLGELFQPPIALESEPAWDVYLVYPPGVEWTDDGPPRPSYFQHQLRGRLPDSLVLDGSVLLARLREAATAKTR